MKNFMLSCVLPILLVVVAGCAPTSLSPQTNTLIDSDREITSAPTPSKSEIYMTPSQNQASPVLKSNILFFSDDTVLPVDTGIYPTWIVKTGGNQYDSSEIASALFGDDMELIDGIYYKDGISVSTQDDSVQYHNNAALFDTPIGLTRSEALASAKNALDTLGVIDASLYSSYEFAIIPELDDDSVNWLSRNEIDYRDRNLQIHSFIFPHRFQNNLRIYGGDEGLRVMLTEKGIRSFQIKISEYTPGDKTIEPKHYIEIVNDIEGESTSIVEVELVYSNYLTNTNKYNLCWLFNGDPHSYIYDLELDRYITI